jgi:hypothetical protein
MNGHQLLSNQKKAFAAEALCFEKPLGELEKLLFLPPQVVEIFQLCQRVLDSVEKIHCV